MYKCKIMWNDKTSSHVRLTENQIDTLSNSDIVSKIIKIGIVE